MARMEAPDKVEELSDEEAWIKERFHLQSTLPTMEEVELRKNVLRELKKREAELKPYKEPPVEVMLVRVGDITAAKTNGRRR